MEGAKVAADFQRHILQRIFVAVTAGQAADIAVKVGLNFPQERFESRAVAGLGEQNQVRPMDAVVQNSPSTC